MGPYILWGNFCRPSVIHLQIQDKDLLLPSLVRKILCTAFDLLWFPHITKNKEYRLGILG